MPEAIVPRDPTTAELIVREADEWFARLTPEQRVGLWLRYTSGAA
jgi:hypothetical protein